MTLKRITILLAIALFAFGLAACELFSLHGTTPVTHQWRRDEHA